MEIQKQKAVEAKRYLTIFLEAIGIINPKEAEASPIHMGKATMNLRKTMFTATRGPKEVEASPMHMGKATIAIKEVTENLMATKKDPPMEDIEGTETMALALSNMSCIINTN